MSEVDLHEMGARVLSVFGPFGVSTLVEMPTSVAQEMFPDGLAVSGRTDVVAATVRDIEAIRKRDEALAQSALAASALALAYELQDPYNGATSKSMCAKALMDALEQLRGLCPPEKETDAVDELGSKREERRAAARLAAAANPSSP